MKMSSSDSDIESDTEATSNIKNGESENPNRKRSIDDVALEAKARSLFEVDSFPPGSVDHIVAALAEKPDIARFKVTPNEVFPIQIACQKQAPAAIIQALYDAWEDCIEDLQLFKQLVFARTPVDVLQKILELDKDSALSSFGTGTSAIHEVCDKANFQDADSGYMTDLLQLLVCSQPDEISNRHQEVLPIEKLLLWDDDKIVLAHVMEVTHHSPLGFVYRHDLDLPVCQAILTRFPNAVQLPSSKDGTFPLHHACRNPKYPLDEIEALIQLFPAAADERSLTIMDTTVTPLHYASQHPFRHELLQRLISLWPESVKTKSSFSQKIPLDIALEEAKEQGLALGTELILLLSGGFPLHVSCQCSIKTGTIDAVLNAFPTAAATPDDDGLYPLHYMAKAGHFRRESEARLFLQIFQLYSPAAMLTCDSNGAGNLPLHYACGAGGVKAHEDVIERLVQEFPDAVCTPNSMGALPLHLAIKSQMTVFTVELLLFTFPESIRTPGGPDEALPIHLAMDHTDIEMQKILTLGRMWPESLGYPNRDGLLPVHIACLREDLKLDDIYQLILMEPACLARM